MNHRETRRSHSKVVKQECKKARARRSTSSSTSSGARPLTPSQVEAQKQMKKHYSVTKTTRTGANAKVHMQVPDSQERVSAVCGPRGGMHLEVPESLIPRVMGALITDPAGTAELTPEEVAYCLSQFDDVQMRKVVACLEFGVVA